MNEKIKLIFAGGLTLATLTMNAVFAPDVIFNMADGIIEFQTQQEYVEFKTNLIEKHNAGTLSIQGYQILADVYNHEIHGGSITLVSEELNDIVGTMNQKISN